MPRTPPVCAKALWSGSALNLGARDIYSARAMVISFGARCEPMRRCALAAKIMWTMLGRHSFQGAGLSRP